MNLFRGIADDLPLIDWLTKEMWPTEARMLCPEFVSAGARHAIAECIRGGTTCFNDMYNFPDSVAEVCPWFGGFLSCVCVCVRVCV